MWWSCSPGISAPPAASISTAPCTAARPGRGTSTTVPLRQTTSTRAPSTSAPPDHDRVGVHAMPSSVSTRSVSRPSGIGAPGSVRGRGGSGSSSEWRPRRDRAVRDRRRQSRQRQIDDPPRPRSRRAPRSRRPRRARSADRRSRRRGGAAAPCTQPTSPPAAAASSPNPTRCACAVATAVRRDRHPDPRPVPRERPGVDPHLLQCPGSRRLDHDVDSLEQRPQLTAARLGVRAGAPPTTHRPCSASKNAGVGAGAVRARSSSPP